MYLLPLEVLPIDADFFPLHVTISTILVVLRLVEQSVFLYSLILSHSFKDRLLKQRNVQGDCTTARIQISKLLYSALTPGLHKNRGVFCIIN